MDPKAFFQMSPSSPISPPDPHLALRPLTPAEALVCADAASRTISGPARFCLAGIETPLGLMIAVSDDRALHLLEFADRKALPDELLRLGRGGRMALGQTAIHAALSDQLGAYFHGHRRDFDIPLALQGTPFQESVWVALQKIPFGGRKSYQDLARELGHDGGVRAVAAANGRNRIAIVIPCHRIVAKDGALTGYGGGIWRKQRLLALERGIFASKIRESA